MTNPSSGHVLRAARRLRIQVPTMSTVVLVRRACEHYNAQHPTKPPVDPRSLRTRPQFVARISVNYLRHELTSYDGNRDAIRRLTSDPNTASHAGAIIKGRTLAAIAETYPHLAAEARRQAVRTDAVTGQRRNR